MGAGDDRVIDQAELGVFDGGVARLRRDGATEGHVVTSLASFRSAWSPWRLQPWVWLDLFWSDGVREPPIEDYPPWTDVRDLLDGFFVAKGLGPSRDGRYAVEWLDEPERSARRRDLGLT